MSDVCPHGGTCITADVCEARSRRERKLDPKLVQRAKDIAARDSTHAYMETLQRELRSTLLTKAEGDEGAAREILVIVEGTHVHEAVVMDGHGGAMLIRAVWEVSVDPKEIAEVVGRSRMEGHA